MKQIAVIGGSGQSAAAKLIGITLHRTAGWRVGVLCPQAGAPGELTQGLRRLDQQGCDCAVATLGAEAEGQEFQLGILTDWTGSRPPKAVAACRQLVVNLDDAWGQRVANLRPSLTYSEGKNQADLTAKFLRCYPTRTEFDALTREEIRRVRLPVLGGYDLYQGLAALGCGLSLGLPLDALARSVEEAEGVPGHREELAAGELPFRIVVDRARTASELEGLLLALRPLCGEGGKLRLALEDSAPGQRTLMRTLGQELADQLAEGGEEISALLDAAAPGDVVVVSGCTPPGSPTDPRRIIRQWLEQKR